MKIAEVRIQNLRGYRDQTVTLNDYTSLVGPNGAGKSTILCALCIFFRDTEHFVTNLHSLQGEDFHRCNTDDPVRITVTFTDLSSEAQEDFKDYYRQGKLVVTAEARYDKVARSGEVKQFGQRMVMRDFRAYFAADGDKQTATYLKGLYQKIREKYPELPDVTVKGQMAAALQAYEAEHPEMHELFPSHDQFYGFSNGVNRLAKYIQWVYIPAVKDASSEQTETKNSALGKLLARTVRSNIDFAGQFAEIRREVTEKYLKLIETNQPALEALSATLENRLREYAHLDARIKLKWQGAPERAIRVDEPTAQIVAGEGGFDGELSRFGHGLQRCYLLALLQELTVSGSTTGPRLILGCDEPELHQHPPQARHLADVLIRLSERNSQVILTTHSPHLVSGDRFADVRLIRKDPATLESTVSHVTIDALANTLGAARGEKPTPLNGAVLKMRQALMPSLNELFFTPVVVFVEGTEDIAYITAYATLLNVWEDFRRQGCHMIAVEGKSRMLHPLAIAKHLGIPAFAVFDADGHTPNPGNRKRHEDDNQAILRLRGYASAPAMPADNFWSQDTVMWKTEIGMIVQDEFGHPGLKIQEKIRVHYGQIGNLEKSTMFVSDYVTEAWEGGLRSPSLEKLTKAILEYAAKSRSKTQPAATQIAAPSAALSQDPPS